MRRVRASQPASSTASVGSAGRTTRSHSSSTPSRAAVAGERPAVAGHRRLDPLPDQVLPHRQPGEPLERDAHPRGAGGGLGAARPGEEQGRARGAQQQIGQAIREALEAARRRGIGQVQDEQVDEAAAGQPTGQLQCLDGVGGADDQQPFQRDAQPGGGRRVEAPERIEPGDQPSVGLAGGQRSERQAGGPAAGRGVEQGQGAARPTAAAQRGIEPGLTGGKRVGGDHRSGVHPTPQPTITQRFEQFGEGLGYVHGPTDDRTDVLVWEAPFGGEGQGQTRRSRRLKPITANTTSTRLVPARTPACSGSIPFRSGSAS